MKEKKVGQFVLTLRQQLQAKHISDTCLRTNYIKKGTIWNLAKFPSQWIKNHMAFTQHIPN